MIDESKEEILNEIYTNSEHARMYLTTLRMLLSKLNQENPDWAEKLIGSFYRTGWENLSHDACESLERCIDKHYPVPTGDEKGE